MSEFKVFYSWQSDLPNATNRGFIGDALEKACKSVANDPEIEEAPRVDQDTQGLPGAPSIPQAIMDKIDSCQAFVADVSLCYVGPEETPAPNPNVVYELGYAVARLGWDRIILVMNTEHGPIEKLPFDLEKRRAIPYFAREGEKDRSEAKKELVGRLADGVTAIAKRQPIVPKRTVADEAIEAIENQMPAKKPRLRAYWQHLMEELRRHEPDLMTEREVSDQIQVLSDSIRAEIHVSAEFCRLCESIALAGDGESARFIGKGFGDLIEEYDHKAAFSGHSYEYWFDYWRFVGHELFTVFVAHLLREEQWDLLNMVLGLEHFWERKRSTSNDGNVRFDELSDHIRLLLVDGEQRGRTCVQADILHERFTQSQISMRVTFVEFVDADLFLYIAGEARNKDKPHWCHWRPWSAVYLNHSSRLIVRARHEGYARGLAVASGAGTLDEFKSLAKERIPALKDLWSRRSLWHAPYAATDYEAIGSRS